MILKPVALPLQINREAHHQKVYAQTWAASRHNTSANRAASGRRRYTSGGKYRLFSITHTYNNAAIILLSYAYTSTPPPLRGRCRISIGNVNMSLKSTVRRTKEHHRSSTNPPPHPNTRIRLCGRLLMFLNAP